MSNLTRRAAILAGASTLVAGRFATAQENARPTICVFTKPFNALSYDELADRIAELGFQGIEAPIRKGGHIEPNRVEEQLPELVEALKQRGLEITVLTSDINDSTDPLTPKVLRTAGSLGIKRYRMKYLRYDLRRPVVDQIAAWRPQFRDLAAMNHEFGVRGLYQNHAGSSHLGATLWDIKQVLREIPKDRIGVAYDIRHATVEGGTSWPITFNMIRPHIDTVYVKDFTWDGRKPKNVPLGEGNIDSQFFKLLAESNFDGPISLHEEYLDHRIPELIPQHLAAMKQDLATLNKWLGAT